MKGVLFMKQPGNKKTIKECLEEVIEIYKELCPNNNSKIPEWTLRCATTVLEKNYGLEQVKTIIRTSIAIDQSVSKKYNDLADKETNNKIDALLENPTDIL